MTPSGKIYLREGDGLVAMSEEPYDAEEILQRLLADYPDLLAGDQIQPSSPRRWLLITQEAPVPDAEGGGGRWSLDHLFVDQDAIPTLVEVKRSSDTRLRREVVGQMLDYAANIAAYWPADRVRTIFEQRCAAAGLDPHSEASALIAAPVDDMVGEDADTVVDDFWQRVGDNIVARRLRLVFVADVIPRELQAIIEFLNEGLATSDVLAVEVKQYVGEGRQTLVPRVIGWTTVAEDIKQGSTRTTRQTPWDEASFFRALGEDPGDWAVPIGRALFDWAGEHGLQVWYGKGRKQATMSVGFIKQPDERHAVFKCHAPGGVMLQFDHLKLLPPFDDSEARVEFRARLGPIEGIDAEQLPDTWPTVRWETLRPNASVRTFLDTYEWAVERIRETTS